MAQLDITKPSDYRTILIQLMTTAVGNDGGDIVKTFGLENTETIDVRITLNGVEVDFISFVRIFEQHHNEHVMRSAIKLLEAKCEAATSALEKLTEHVQRVGRDTLGYVDHDDTYHSP
jgi:hypothetical protein